MATTTTPCYLNWSSVIAGTVVALAVTILLAHFGGTLGYTYTHLTSNSDKLWDRFIILGLWTLWTQLMASMAGAYAAGRTRRPWVNTAHESEVRDGFHGLLVWGLSTVLVAIAAAIVGFWATFGAAHGIEPKPVLPEMTSHKLSVIWSFSLTAFSLVSATAAYWMGTIGGDHRDRAVDISERISFRRTTAKKKR